MKNLPTKLNFDICTFCNHKCTFCSNEDIKTLKANVSYDDFIKVMDNVTRYMKISELGLSAKGEVSLNKDLIKIVKATKERYKISYVYISTNGSLLDHSLAEHLLEAGLDSIKFSINGYDDESYLKMHQRDDFQQVIKNMNTLLELKARKYPNLKILISSIIDISTDLLKEKLNAYFRQSELINDILHYKITYTPKFKDFITDITQLKPCSLVFNEIYIDADCRLALCCKDYFKEFDFGSLLTNDFKTLYFSDKMKGIRLMHKNMSFPDNHFCKNCLIFEANRLDD